MKAHGSRTRWMVTGFTIMHVVQFTMESGKTASIMERVSMNSPMEPYTKANGKTTKCMELDSLSTPMAENGKGSTEMESFKPKDKSNSCKKRKSRSESKNQKELLLTRLIQCWRHWQKAIRKLSKRTSVHFLHQEKSSRNKLSSPIQNSTKNHKRNGLIS